MTSIDHDALSRVILDHFHAPDDRHSSWWINTDEMSDAILALVEPAAGINLTPEEARLAERALREYGAEPYTLDYEDTDAMDALAARLEASA